MQYEADRGYLIVAGTSDSVDYITCAETLVKSLKYWHPDVQVCLITDQINYQNPLLIILDHSHKVTQAAGPLIGKFFMLARFTKL